MVEGQGAWDLNLRARGSHCQQVDRESVTCLSDRAFLGGWADCTYCKGVVLGRGDLQTSRHLSALLISTSHFKGQETETGPGEGQRHL